MKGDILFRLFEITGNEKDSLIYLKTFRSISPERFALIHIDSLTFSENGESIIYDLKVLQKLELFPILLISEQAKEYIEIFFKSIIEWGKSTDELKLHSELIDLDDNFFKKIKSSILAFRIPFLIYNSKNWEYPVSKILSEVKSQKVIFLNQFTIFKETNTNLPLSYINLNQDYEFIKRSKNYIEDDINLLEKMKFILEEFNPDLKSISITTPNSLLKELFTIKGSGTYIKLGTEIVVLRNKNLIEKKKLETLLETSFGKKIKEGFLDSPFDSIILEADYRGAAIIKKTELGAFLSKFAVDEIARGEGIGRDIWEKMKKRYTEIFWRSKPNNPINKWYSKQCDGFVKLNEWSIFWIGLGPKKIYEVVEYLRLYPIDFYE